VLRNIVTTGEEENLRIKKGKKPAHQPTQIVHHHVLPHTSYIIFVL